MARELIVAWTGKRRPAWEALCEDYASRIDKMSSVREVLVRPGTGPDGVRIAREGEALLAALPDPSLIVALDRRGKTLSSPQLAEKLGHWNETWPHPIVFALGSDLGLSREVLEAAELRLSLGALTLPHELARLVVYEQLYRALAIQRGIKYHRVPLDGH
ncbi:MAG: 23S rRNA (pseudouridine(1915)-N(3))-methyltransferase RlmH [Acidobacteriota bacterium]